MEQENFKSPEEMSEQDIESAANESQAAQKKLAEEFEKMSDDELKKAYEDAWSRNPEGEELWWDNKRGVSGADIQQTVLYEMSKRGLLEKK